MNDDQIRAEEFCGGERLGDIAQTAEPFDLFHAGERDKIRRVQGHPDPGVFRLLSDQHQKTDGDRTVPGIDNGDIVI